MSVDLELVEFARRVVEANGDGEVNTVGAAVRDAQGRMFGGINLHHFTGGPCAELVALGHARAVNEAIGLVATSDQSQHRTPRRPPRATGATGATVRGA
ncbi:hypothetical protein ACFXPW_32865 [Streptomyces goshikiensis]|uniref:hypothetical protein n=1 Tax=Streptomyces goshikiensis TaxID=1942 RepID=UPI0036BF9777